MSAEDFSDVDSITDLGLRRQQSEDFSVTSTGSFRAFTPRSFNSIPMSPRQSLENNAKSILGKITCVNYSILLEKFTNLKFSTEEDIKLCVRIIINQCEVSKDEMYSKMFAELSSDILSKWDDSFIEIIDEESKLKFQFSESEVNMAKKSSIFKYHLLLMCQEKFEKDWLADIIAIRSRNDFSESDKEDKSTKLKNSREGVANFIIQLFYRKIIPFDVLRRCIDGLLNFRMFVDFDDINGTFVFKSLVEKNDSNVELSNKTKIFIEGLFDNIVSNIEELKNDPNFNNFLPRDGDLIMAFMMIRTAGLEICQFIRNESSKKGKKAIKMKSIIPNIFKRVEFIRNIRTKDSNFRQVYFCARSLIEWRQKGIEEGLCTEFIIEIVENHIERKEVKTPVEASRKFWL